MIAPVANIAATAATAATDPLQHVPEPEDRRWETHLYPSPSQGVSTDWETHLHPSPDGNLLVAAQYNRGNGDILNRLLRQDRTDFALHLIVPERPEDRHHYFLVENGRAREIGRHECVEALEDANPASERSWSYPLSHLGRAMPGRYIPVGPDFTPELQTLMQEHDWRDDTPEYLPTCFTCEARLFKQYDQHDRLQRVRVSLPLGREAHYRRTDGEIAPCSDVSFYGGAPLRIGPAAPERPERRPVRRTRRG